MTIALLIAATWALGLTAVLAICRSAARGDRAMTAHSDESRWRDSHERPLAA